MTQSKEATNVKPGSRWRSAVCECEIVVVRAPHGSVALSIGGTRVLAAGASRPDGVRLDESLADGTRLGKRYADEVSGLEVLCTKSGTGTITVDGRPATVLAPRPLPASD
jgi:hypothetical protein